MKKIITIVAVLLSMAAAAAQTAHRTALDKLCDALSSSCVDMECSYLMYVSQTRMSGEAKVSVQGESYTMVGNGLQVYCDGSKVWTVDSTSKEVYVESVDDMAANSLANPAALFMRLGTSFEVVSSSPSNGRFSYRLAPKDDFGVLSAELVLSQDGTPQSAVFVLEESLKVDVTVQSMTIEKTKPEDAFRPQVSSGSDWIVTEL